MFIVPTVFALFFGIPIWAIVALNRRQRKQAEDEYAARLEPTVAQLIEAIRFGQFLPVEAAAHAYKIKRGEQLICVVDNVQCAVPKTKTVRYNYSGLRYRARIVGGLSWSAGSTQVQAVQQTSLAPEGTGTLVITSQRCLFNAVGMTSDWSRSWGGVANIVLLADGVQIDLTTGKPRFFRFGQTPSPQADPRRDPVYVWTAAHLAHDLNQGE